MSQMGVDYLCFLYVTLNYEHVNSMLIFSFEFSACNKCIFSARDNVRNQVLRIFREIRNNRTTYAICSIVMCGTPNIIALSPTETSIAPFNVADHVQNPYFTIQQTRQLFHDFEHDNGIMIDATVEWVCHSSRMSLKNPNRFWSVSAGVLSLAPG
jgi:hypothetical protein